MILLGFHRAPLYGRAAGERARRWVVGAFRHRGFSLSPRELVRRCRVFSRWATCLDAGMVLALATVGMSGEALKDLAAGIIPGRRLIAT